MEFQCSKCTACCLMAGELGIMPRRSDGACKYLTKDNLCSIYDKRPLECNVKRMAKHLKMSEKKYYKKVSGLCNQYMDYYGMDEKYKLDPTIYNKEKK